MPRKSSTRKKVIFRESPPRGPSEEPVAEEAEVVDNIAKEGEDEKPFSTDQVGRVHHDQGGEGSRDDLDRNRIFRNIFLVKNLMFRICKGF